SGMTKARIVCGTLLALAAGACNCNGKLATSPGDVQWKPLSLSLTANAGATTQGTITLTNQGTNAVDVQDVSFQGDSRKVFSQSGPTSFTVAAGSNAPVTVAYAPPSAGSDSAQLQIETDASNAPSISISLQGNCPGASSSGGSSSGGSSSSGSSSGGSSSG